MANLEEVWTRIRETQKKQKDIRNSYKDALATSPTYQETLDKFNTLKEKKKSIEAQIKNSFGSEFDKLESMKLDIQTDKELLSDIALTQLMKGQTVELKDEHDNEYEPHFSVKFTKV